MSDVLVEEGLDALKRLGLYSCAQRIAELLSALDHQDRSARRALFTAGYCGDGNLAEMITRALGEAKVAGKAEVSDVFRALDEADRAFPEEMEGTVATRVGLLRARVRELEEELARWQPSIDVLRNLRPSRLDEMIASLEAKPGAVEPVPLPQELIDALSAGEE